MSDDERALASEDFTAASRVDPLGDGRYRAELPDGWQQGRGAFGGLVLGTLARAMRHAEPEADRALRVLNGEVVGPVVAGPADVAVRALRRGNGVSSWEASLAQGGQLLARASALMGRARTTERDGTWLDRPTMPPWDEAMAVPIGPPMGPQFATKYELRSTGVTPFTGGSRPGAEGWVRMRRPAPLGVPELIGLMDAWWPTTFAVETGPRPMATVAFTFELLADPASLDAAEPLFYRASAPGGRGGFLVEFRELWTARGDLVALNQQTFVIIK